MSFQIVNREIFYQFWIKNNCKKEDFNKRIQYSRQTGKTNRDNLMNFKNATEYAAYFKTYYLQGLLFAFHETTQKF